MTPLTMTADQLAEIRAYADGTRRDLIGEAAGDRDRIALLAEVDALHERLGDRQCVCAPVPADFDGPLAVCDVHGLPSAAYQQGIADARQAARDVLDLLDPALPNNVWGGEPR